MAWLHWWWILPVGLLWMSFIALILRIPSINKSDKKMVLVLPVPMAVAGITGSIMNMPSRDLGRTMFVVLGVWMFLMPSFYKSFREQGRFPFLKTLLLGSALAIFFCIVWFSFLW